MLKRSRTQTLISLPCQLRLRHALKASTQGRQTAPRGSPTTLISLPSVVEWNPAFPPFRKAKGIFDLGKPKDKAGLKVAYSTSTMTRPAFLEVFRDFRDFCSFLMALNACLTRKPGLLRCEVYFCVVSIAQLFYYANRILVNPNRRRDLAVRRPGSVSALGFLSPG